MQRSSADKSRNSGPFYAASFHAQKASQLLGAVSPSPAPSELEVSEGRRSWEEALSTSREQSSSQLTLLARRPRTTLTAVPAWHWASVLFFLPLSFSLCLSVLLAGTCRRPAPGWPSLAGTAFTLWGSVRRPSAWVTPQNGSVVFYSGQAFRDQTQARNARSVPEPGKKEIQ